MNVRPLVMEHSQNILRGLEVLHKSLVQLVIHSFEDHLLNFHVS